MEPEVKKNSSTSSFEPPAAFMAALGLCTALLFTEILLPVNAFTHRVWEAVIVRTFHTLLPGPFYPGQKISMEEQGDLAPYTRFAVKKQANWETDRYGYRRKDSANRDYEVVIVGDSTTVGTGLTQDDMLSVKLESFLRKPVYPFAPYYEMDTYLKSAFYKNHPPKRVVFSMMEWALPDLIETKPPASSLHEKSGSWLDGIAILLDRVSKMSLMRFLTARIKGFVKNKTAALPFSISETSEGPMVFPQGKSSHEELSLALVPKIVSVLKRYHEELNRRGIPMIFLPVPNKESFYYQLIPGRSVPIFYITLAKAANEAGIPTLDLIKFYANSRMKNRTLLYHLDDSHWNRYGAELAAEGLIQMIEPKKSPP